MILSDSVLFISPCEEKDCLGELVLLKTEMVHHSNLSKLKFLHIFLTYLSLFMYPPIPVIYR